MSVTLQNVMANSESEGECAVKQKQPQPFPTIPSLSDNEGSLCQLEPPDSHLVLTQEVGTFTPSAYNHYRRHEGYSVLSMVGEEGVNLDVSQPQKKLKTNAGGAFDTTETDTPSSEEPNTAERRKPKRRAASIMSDSSVKGYGGDDENESRTSDVSRGKLQWQSLVVVKYLITVAFLVNYWYVNEIYDNIMTFLLSCQNATKMSRSNLRPSPVMSRTRSSALSLQGIDAISILPLCL